MKGTTKAIILSFLTAAFILGVAASANIDIRLLVPTDGGANSSTNDTQTFSFNYTSNVTPAGCMLRLNDINASILTEVANETETAIYPNRSIPAGRINWSVRCYNVSAGVAAINNTYIFFSDVTNPNVPTVQTSSPADFFNTSTNETIFSCNMREITDNLFDNINLSLVLNSTINQTTTGVKANATYNFTVPWPAAANSGIRNWNCRATDNATNSNSTTNRTITVDRNAPVVGASGNASVNMSIGRDFGLEYNVTWRDMTYIDSCWSRVYSTNGSYVDVQGTINGSIPLNATSNNVKCTMRITDLTEASLYGRMIVEFWAKDHVNNNATQGTNQTNVTIVKLFPGWNIMLVDRSMTLDKIGNLSSNITQVSRFNNTPKVFTTYVKGVTANSAVVAQDGEAIYVYANQTTYIGRNWTYEGGGDFANLTGVTYGIKSGWNLVSHFNATGLKFYEICNEAKTDTLFNITANFTHISYYQSNESKFVSHRCDFKYANNTFVPMGYGFWAFLNNTNATASYRIIRSP